MVETGRRADLSVVSGSVSVVVHDASPAEISKMELVAGL